jgi:hypothetical protein
MASGTCRCQLNGGMSTELHRSWLCYILLGICSERLLAAASMQTVLRVPDMGRRPCCLVWISQDGSARVLRHVQRQMLASKKQNNRMSGVAFVVDNVGEH